MMPPVTLNGEQEAAAYRKGNTVVAAGAGSGKTSVLASRYAYLVTEAGLSVDRILTLTFTRKAAAEMYRRIYGALTEIAQGEAGPRRERAEIAVRDFFRARIQTLDSYSAAIVRQAALRYGVSPDFTIDDARCRALAEEAALPFLIARRHHPALEALYQKSRPRDIASKVFAETVSSFSALDDPPDFASETEAQFRIALEEWESAAAALGESLGELTELAEHNAGERGSAQDSFLTLLAPRLERYREGAAGLPGAERIGSYFAALSAAPGADCVALAENHPLRKELLESLFFLNDLAWTDTRGGKRKSRAKELIGDLRAAFGSFSSLAVFCIQGGVILSVMRLLDEFQAQCLEKKRREKVLSFSDTARLARTILRDHADIRQSEKETFEAIMIDEFQDNNELQRELLFLLAEKPDRLTQGVPGAEHIAEEKLFFVGDEKQSIYRFRGADVSVFRKLRDEFGGGSLSLRTNYRSRPALIGAFNALFGGSAFDPLGEAAPGEFPSVFAGEGPPYEAAYTPLRSPASEGAETEDALPALRVYVLDGSQSPDSGEDGQEESPAGERLSEERLPKERLSEEQLQGAENEALFTAEKIRDLLAQRDSGGAVKYRPEDIAVLFRSHSPQRALEKYFRLFGIPYTAEGMAGFFSDGPVNDMLALLRLAVYPLDTEAYAVTLRSPFAGLSLRGLGVCITVFNRAREGPAPLPFSAEALPLLGREDRERYLRGGELYEGIREQAKRENIASLVSRLWYDEGYRYETEWHPQTRSFRELYDYLFALAVKADREGLSLAGFTDSLAKRRDGDLPAAEQDIPLERGGAVRLMTIHKSKGLEFPVVFLVCCGNRSRNNGLEGAVYRTPQGGLALSPPLPPECSGRDNIKRNFFYEQSLAEERAKKTAELRRLLYVAMTRAERELYITGSFPLGADGGAAEDLPERLRAAVQHKLESQAADDKKKGVKRLPGDSVIDNDTLLGLLLPAICARLPGGLSGGEDLRDAAGSAAFFSLESIPSRTDDYIRRLEEAGASKLRNDRSGLSRFIGSLAPAYETAAVLDTPKLPPPYRTPSSFHAPSEGLPALPEGSFRHDREHSGEGGEDLFAGVDRILARRPAPYGEAFSAADFGTLAHACVESLLEGRAPSIPPGLGGRLNPPESEIILDAAAALAERFLRSPLGLKARNAALRKSEYPFRSLITSPEGESVFITGSIDLLFEDGECVYVADFKADRSENPEEHIPQMSFYYRAALELRGKPCRLWLYYLRSGRAVEVMEDALRSWRP
ncbi:MAG: UvrD-helicase domain-containing protein [Spirochaetaceae bacterium]|jgi:ATP-dependent helicase/nuclease subunit A|nr:UvrD-helicase domain-containing protein [Spirochaetaceae bacterium]